MSNKKTLSSILQDYAHKINDFLGPLGWTVLLFMVIIIFLVSYYTQKINRLQADSYYPSYTSTSFDPFDLHRLGQQRMRAMWEDMEQHMRRQQALFDTLRSRALPVTGSQAQYRGFRSVNDTQMNYDIAIDNGQLSGTVNHTNPSVAQAIAESLQAQGARVDYNDTMINFQATGIDLPSLVQLFESVEDSK